MRHVTSSLNHIAKRISQRGKMFVISVIYMTFVLSTRSADSELTSIEDNILLRINWKGGSDVLPSDKEIMSVTSADDEKYKCVIPSMDSSDKDESDKVSSEPASSIMRKLHRQSTCSYRMEQYWTYELCHGKHIMQYHEEKEMGRKTKRQEYYLGRFDESKNKLEDDVKPSSELPTKRIEDKNVPYYEVVYTDGTYCDLIDGPRTTRVYYVCHEQGRNEIYSQEEISSCEYQVTILTHLLCAHPSYRPVEHMVTDIMCYAQDGSPVQPNKISDHHPATGSHHPPPVRGLAELVDLTSDDDDDDDVDDEDDDDDESGGGAGTRITVTVHPDGSTTATTSKTSRTGGGGAGGSGAGGGAGGSGAGGSTGRRRAQPLQIDKALMAQFLQGKHCLQGGRGYWRHEICYGRYVQQYHEEVNKVGKKAKGATVFLGYWDADKHKKLLVEKEKRYKESVKTRALQMYMKHLYVDGDVCDVTGKSRQVEVKLKCVHATNANQVAIYLSEPKTCEYVMVVESPIICQLLDGIDDYGIPQIKVDDL